jgi:hypothetical protein
MRVARILSIVNFAGLIALVTIAASRAPETPEILRALGFGKGSGASGELRHCHIVQQGLA